MEKPEALVVYKVPPFEWCSMVKGKMKKNRTLQLLFKVIKLTAPTLVHDCPYEGLMELNLKPSKVLFLLYPPSSHTVEFNCVDHESKASIFFSFEIEILQ